MSHGRRYARTAATDEYERKTQQRLDANYRRRLENEEPPIRRQVVIGVRVNTERITEAEAVGQARIAVMSLLRTHSALLAGSFELVNDVMYDEHGVKQIFVTEEPAT